MSDIIKGDAAGATVRMNQNIVVLPAIANTDAHSAEEQLAYLTIGLTVIDGGIK